MKTKQKTIKPKMVSKTIKMREKHAELFSILLKKADLTFNDFFEIAYKKWAIQHIDDLLSNEEKLKFNDILSLQSV